MALANPIATESLSEPRLWCDAASLAGLRARLAAGDQHLIALIAACRHLAAEEDARPTMSWGVPVQAELLLAVLARDQGEQRLERCLDQLRARAASDTVATSDLGRATLAVCAAMTLDLGGHLLTPADAAELADLVAEQAHRFREHVGPGNPHHVTNNWWAVTHGACLIAALAADGRARRDTAELASWAGGRLWAFCHHFGDEGLYHEGLGYQGYTCSYLLPALLAWRRCGGRDALARFRQLGRSAASLMIPVTLRPTPHDSDSDSHGEAWGASLSWNDAGFGAPDHAALPAMIACAPRQQRGALRWLYDRLRGHAGDRSFAAAHGGLVLSALLYPYEVPVQHPQEILPRTVTDGRIGFHLARADWRDGDDATLGILARSTHVGGHAQDDAASLRFAALGCDWIVGGGQNRPDAAFQSVPTPADGHRPTRPLACGALVYDEPTERGSVVGIDHRKACGCYAERYVGWRSDPDNEPVHAALALLDCIDDHDDRDWHWHWSIGRGIAIEFDADHAGFTLRGAADAELRARFLGARPDALELLQLPDSERTYSGGITLRYPGRPYLRARFAAARPLHVLVAATIARGTAPVPMLRDGLDLDLGGAVWSRPFASALPSGFRLGRSANLMTRPNGS